MEENFKREIKGYSIEDLELIEDTQKDLYSEEEMKYIREVLKEKINKEKNELKKTLPKEIKCPKCDGMNDLKNDICSFCNYSLKEIKAKYEDIEYLRNINEENNENFNEKKTSGFSFQYIISFLIPLIGFILGAILLANEDEDKKSKGKACIILGVMGMVIVFIGWMIMLNP